MIRDVDSYAVSAKLLVLAIMVRSIETKVWRWTRSLVTRIGICPGLAKRLPMVCNNGAMVTLQVVGFRYSSMLSIVAFSIIYCCALLLLAVEKLSSISNLLVVTFIAA